MSDNPNAPAAPGTSTSPAQQALAAETQVETRPPDRSVSR